MNRLYTRWHYTNSNGIKSIYKPFNQKYSNSNQSVFYVPKRVIKYSNYGNSSVLIKISKYYISLPKKFIIQSKFSSNEIVVLLSQSLKFYRYSKLPTKQNKCEGKVEITENYGVTYQIDLQKIHQHYQNQKYFNENNDIEKIMQLKAKQDQKNLEMLEFARKNSANHDNVKHQSINIRNNAAIIENNLGVNSWDWDFS